MMAWCAPSVTSIASILPTVAPPKLELKFKYFIPLWVLGYGCRNSLNVF